MAILTSPGVDVTIIDESQYIPAPTNSVPFFLVATAQNKVAATGTGIAAGTTAASANETYLITSQRDLSTTFGNPFFYNTSAGTAINGYELNEYGLLAAYSALGTTNRAYVQRVDVDLAALTASLGRPAGDPDNGDYWLDTVNSTWGIFEWNQTTNAMTNKIPAFVITDTVDLQSNTTIPLNSLGTIGEYAVTTTNTFNPGYFKRGGPTSAQTSASALSDLYNTWVLIGSDDWKTAWPTIAGTLAPSSLTAANTISINDTTVTVPASPNNTVTGLSNAINTAAITGVYAGVISGKLQLFAESTATNDGSTGGDGIIAINNLSGTPLATLGITGGEYRAPELLYAPSYSAPRWRTTDSVPQPTGSVWLKVNNVNLGLNLIFKKWSSALAAFVTQTAKGYTNEAAAIYDLDPSGGGKNIAAGTTITKYNPYNDETFAFKILERYATGATIITGDDATPTFTSAETFTIVATEAGEDEFSAAVTVTLTGTTPALFVTAVSAANVPYVSASIDSSGYIVFTHSQGGTMVLTNVSGTPIEDAGINITVRGVRQKDGDDTAGFVLSNFVEETTFEYTSSATAPNTDPADETLWYYSSVSDVDIMIQDGGDWKGYQNVALDVRGFDLTDTNATGPIVSASEPTTQNDTAESALVYGDLWIDTSDLENYPVIKRWQDVDDVDQWVTIDNTDATTQDGVLFADARWATDQTTHPVDDDEPTIEDLLVSNYLDIDAPDPALFPEGTLLFNSRRSGYNVKKYRVDYFNAADFPDETLPTEKDAWVTASGLKSDLSPYMGRQAQRAIIVAALKAGIDGNTDVREEQRQFNLMSCPGYPELVANLVLLNNDRDNTGFVVGDTPVRLANSGTDILAFANSTELTADEFAATFWPACQTTNPFSGATVVAPASHMMVRTIIRSDEIAFPWFAPAGIRRGVVDNATAIGYVNAQTGAFVSVGVNQALRDVCYENRINPITFIPGAGVTNFGNKTTTSATTALDRINVSRLVVFIRSRLVLIGKQFLFEPNDEITRNELKNQIDGLMIDLVAKRGIFDYLVVCDQSNNTPARIDRNELYVDIAIEPSRAVEFIYIPVRIKNTGEIAAQTI